MVTAVVLTSSFNPAYKVIRCAAECGARVIVVGTAGSRESPTRLAKSRFCAAYLEMPATLADGDAAASWLDSILKKQDAEWLIPADIEAFRFLITHADSFRETCYPLPTLAVFDELNDKSSFAHLCRTLQIPHPKTLGAPDAQALLPHLGEFGSRPVMVKPTRSEGGRGVFRLDPQNREKQLASLPLGPVLAQEYVSGSDRCISLFCIHGEPVASIAYSYDRGVYRVFRNEKLYELARRIVRHTNYSGAVNFDARETPSGDFYLIECNPRFWYNVDIALLAGLNFVALGFEGRGTSQPERFAADMQVRSVFTVLRHMWRPGRTTPTDRRYLSFVLNDAPGFIVRDAYSRIAKRAIKRAH